jgi:hypothetical protein
MCDVVEHICTGSCHSLLFCTCCPPLLLPATAAATALRTGVYVAVDFLEVEFGKCDLVEQIWLYGSNHV